MALTGSINTALTGIRATQAGIDLVARNIANADSDGYTRKTLNTQANIAGGRVIGVLIGEAQRSVDQFLQQQYRNEIAAQGNVDVRASFLALVDQFFGEPGGSTGLDTIINEFSDALQDLATTPDQASTQLATVNAATALVRQINQLSSEVQNLRTQAEASLSGAVLQANSLLQTISDLNQDITIGFNSRGGVADLQDQRDLAIDELAILMDIRVADGGRGTAKIFTNGGDLLLDGTPVSLQFDSRGSLDFNSTFSTDENERGVGTLKIVDSTGGAVDLFANGTIKSGKIAAYRDLRDDILTKVQAQLDDLAGGIAQSLSNVELAGSAVASGGGNGFDLDIGSLQAGNAITLTVTNATSGVTSTISLVRVDDASVLPLPNSATAITNDTVFGIDFSGGFAGAIAAINTALGANINATTTGGTTLRVVDDGTAAVTIGSLSATVTATAVSGSGVVLPLFVDNAGSEIAYSASLDRDGQKAGISARLTVNSLIIADSSLLVKFAATTASGDPARPQDLVSRFSEASFTFGNNPSNGGSGVSFTGTISAFTREFISFQSNLTDLAAREKESQDIVTDTLESRFTDDTKVNVDVEVSQLIVLQNAFAANARVLSVVQELIDILLRA